ncbi:MAG: hypothetical protein KDH94_08255, partial [Coxiellaceae bacterium]|nr:hypothetical protein [Coxiellaceae bacterium]
QDMTYQVGQSRSRMGSESLGAGRAAVGAFERKNPYLNPDKGKKNLSASANSKPSANGGAGSGNSGTNAPGPSNTGSSTPASTSKNKGDKIKQD